VGGERAIIGTIGCKNSLAGDREGRILVGNHNIEKHHGRG